MMTFVGVGGSEVAGEGGGGGGCVKDSFAPSLGLSLLSVRDLG